jgi:cobalt-zinc-cadmium efflux system outer membrane protein
MRRRFARRLLPGVVGLTLAGCRIDPAAGPGGPPLPLLDLATAREAAKTAPPPRPTPAVAVVGPRRIEERLEVPPEFPGASIPPIRVPRSEPGREAERERIITELYGAPRPLPPDPVPATGQILDLVELQRRAMEIHPTLRQAVNAVESARGTAIQAGLPPNPSFGFEADTVGSGGTAGQQGAKYEQLIKTAGKLKLAQEAALVDVVNAQVALRRVQIDLATQVRSAYFGVLVAEENLRLAHALTVFAERIFQVQVDQVRGSQAAAYEPLALRALAEQARLTLAQARNRYTAAWRQLATAVGDPQLPPSRLNGTAIMKEPDLDYDLLRERILSQHTDLVTAANGIVKAKYNLRLAQVTPIPDVSLKLVVQKDYTTPPFYTTANVEVGVPIPVWDRNQGGIKQAGADLARAVDELPRVRLELLNRLADGMERYQSNKQIVDTYLSKILPDQVRAYRGTIQQPQPNFGDIVTAQQQLNQFLATYLAALQAQWQAVVDLAGLAQLADLYPLGSAAETLPAEPPAMLPPEVPHLPPPMPAPPADAPANEEINWKGVRKD